VGLVLTIECNPFPMKYTNNKPLRALRAKPAANPRANYERYISLARESVQVSDAVETENWLQHADHYFRMMHDPARER